MALAAVFAMSAIKQRGKPAEGLIRGETGRRADYASIRQSPSTESVESPASTRPMKTRSPVRVLKVGMDAQLVKSSDKLSTGVAGGAR
jgi:hypothetical protein